MVCYQHEEMGGYLSDIGHPEGEAVKSFEVENIRLKWASNVTNTDCGVYLMKHLELFNGRTFDCPQIMGRAKQNLLLTSVTKQRTIIE